MKRLLVKIRKNNLSRYLHNDYSYTNYGRYNLYENNVHHAYLMTYTYYLLDRSNWNLH